MKVKKGKTGYPILDYCHKCGSSNGTMRVQLYRGEYLCISHLIQEKTNNSEATKKLERDRDWWNSFFDEITS